MQGGQSLLLINCLPLHSCVWVRGGAMVTSQFIGMECAVWSLVHLPTIIKILY